MLAYLGIKNLALIESAELEFHEGFNVLTGETGSGKSVLTGAIALLAGARADKSLIRGGSSRCEICAAFKVSEQLAARIKGKLEKFDIEPGGGELTLRRVITESGTRVFVNDCALTLTSLREISDILIDLHAANEHQSLIDPARQLDILDEYAKLTELKNTCADICAEIAENRRNREKLLKNIPSPVEAEHLRMIAEEISSVNPEPDEDTTLFERYSAAANSREIIETSSALTAELNEADNSLADQVAQVYRRLEHLNSLLSSGLENSLALCENISDNIREIARSLEEKCDNIELDEAQFNELEERISAIDKLKRRYGGSLESVLLTLEEANAKLAAFSDSESQLKELDLLEAELREKLKNAADKLSAARKKAAKTLCAETVSKLHFLGFEHGKLEIQFHETAPTANGGDRIEMMFSANAGEALKSLREVASSGEISRVMLALKTVLANADMVDLLIFDEIDVNIGGETAVKVGTELGNLAKSHQLICISHLPQVAASAAHHYAVGKSVINGRSHTQVKELSGPERETEIARMLGNAKSARQHAKELLDAGASADELNNQAMD